MEFQDCRSAQTGTLIEKSDNYEKIDELIDQRRQYNRKYWKSLTSEQIEHVNRRRRKRRKYTFLTEEQVKKRREYMREYYKQMNPEKKQEINQRRCKTVEQREIRRQKYREYYRKLSPEKKKERKQKQRDYKQKLSETQKNKENEQKTSDYLQNLINLKKSARQYTTDKIKDFSKDIKLQHFCYNCRTKFLNSTALFEHIVEHVTLPAIIISRIDEHKKAMHIKIESQFTMKNNVQ